MQGQAAVAQELIKRKLAFVWQQHPTKPNLELPVPKRQAKPGRGGGSSHQTASGERAVSPSTTSTSSWTRCGGRTIGEWMAIDRRDPRLDWKRAETANLQDDRYLGKPCRGDHDTTNPLARHANQYKVSYKCARCELVMLYVPRHGATGKYRQHGPLGPTVGKINFEEITKERRPRASSKERHPQEPPIPQWSDSEDSFEKEGISEEEETPWVETGKKRATMLQEEFSFRIPGNSSQSAAGSHAPGVAAAVNDLMRDSSKTVSYTHLTLPTILLV